MTEVSMDYLKGRPQQTQDSAKSLPCFLCKVFPLL
jgi:hypothetical protein